MSKRNQMREKRRRARVRSRAVTIAAVVGVALLVTILFVLPKPVGEITLPEFKERPMADGRAMGDPDSPVTIQAFADFQCHSCVNFAFSTEAMIAETYVASGDVYYIFRQYPFIDDTVVGSESDQAASASMCAADQNRFWDYHDILFANWNGANQGAFSDVRLVAFAEAIDLDMSTFETCFESRTHYDVITQDLELGGQMLVTGTPALFVNGEQVAPGFVPTFAQVSEVVDAHLAAAEVE
jgi:protein-disulfide isomerase